MKSIRILATLAAIALATSAQAYQVTGEIKKGAKVTIEYTINARSVEVKTAKK